MHSLKVGSAASSVKVHKLIRDPQEESTSTPPGQVRWNLIWSLEAQSTYHGSQSEEGKC